MIAPVVRLKLHEGRLADMVCLRSSSSVYAGVKAYARSFQPCAAFRSSLLFAADRPGVLLLLIEGRPPRLPLRTGAASAVRRPSTSPAEGAASLGRDRLRAARPRRQALLLGYRRSAPTLNALSSYCRYRQKTVKAFCKRAS